MPILIYQLGDVPLFHTLTGGQKGVSVDLGRAWRNPTTEFSGVGGSVSYLPLTRSLPESPKYKLSGTFNPIPPYPLSRLMSACKSLGGRRNVPLIGFFVENPMLMDERAARLVWVYTHVMVTDVDDRVEYQNFDDDWSYDQQGVSFTLEGELKWRTLSPWFWEYRDPFEFIDDPISASNTQVGSDNYFHHPEFLDDLQTCYYFFRWQSNLADYNPTFWGAKYTNGLIGGFGSDYTDFGSIEFYSDPLLWSADPSSVYAFTGLSPAGSISITVQRPTGLFASQVEEQVSTLDLEELNDDMIAAGYTSGLKIDDVVFTGLAWPLPGFVLRDGERLTGFAPKWEYPGTYPGETGRGYNHVLISSVGTTGQVGYLHDYGMY